MVRGAPQSAVTGRGGHLKCFGAGAANGGLRVSEVVGENFLPTVAATLPGRRIVRIQKAHGEVVFDNLTLEANRRRLAA